MYLLLVMAFAGFMAVARGNNVGYVARLFINIICGLSVAGVLLYFWKGKLGIQILLGNYIVVLIVAPVYWILKYATLFDIRLVISFIGNIAIICELLNALRIESILEGKKSAEGKLM